MTQYDFELEEEVTGTPQGTKAQLFKPVNLFYLLMIILIIFGKGHFGTENVDKAFMYGSIGIVAVFTAGMIWISFYHKTAKIVWPGGHSTTTGRFETVGNYRMIRLDGLRSGQIEWQQNKGILIAPSITIEKKGNSFVIHARCRPVQFNRLPRVIRQHIRLTGYKPPYVMGYINEEQHTDMLKPDETPLNKKVPVGQIVSLLEDTQEENALLSQMLSRETGILEDFADMSNRIFDRTAKERKSTLKKIREKIEEEHQ